MKHRLQSYVAEFGTHVVNAFDLTAWQLGTALRYFGVNLTVQRGRVVVHLRHLMPDGGAETLAELVCDTSGTAYSPPFFLPDMEPGLLVPVVVEQTRDAEFTLFFGTDDAPANGYQRVAYLCHSETARKAHAATDAFGRFRRMCGDTDDAFLVLAREAPSVDQSHVTTLPGPARESVTSLVLGGLAEKNASHVCSFGGQTPHPEMFARTAAFLRYINHGLRLGAPVYSMRWLSRIPDTIGAVGTTDGEDPGAGLKARSLESLVGLNRMPDSAPAGWDCLPLDDLQRMWLGEYGPGAIVPLSLWVLDDGTATTARLSIQAPETPTVQSLQRQLIEMHRKIDHMREEIYRLHQTTRSGHEMFDLRLDGSDQLRGDLERANHVALEFLHNRHAGQRAVIVGNGPSLQIGDLARLRDVVSFASNKIYLAFSETSWRPDYYSVEDTLVMSNNLPAIEALTGMTKLFPAHMRDSGYVAPDAIFAPVLAPKSYEDPLSDPEFPQFSGDLRRGIAWGSTIIYSQIQMAVHMGFREIVLIGLDHAYELPRRRQGKLMVHDGEVNHFHPAYREEGELWHPPNLHVLDVSYRKARAACDAAGVTIVNASRTTTLDVFERAAFDTLFPDG